MKFQILGCGLAMWAALVLAAERPEETMTLTVPDAAWELAVDEVIQVGAEIWVIAVVSRQGADRVGAAVISTARATIPVALPEGPRKYIVIGKTWRWANEEPYRFIRHRGEIEKEVSAGRRLYSRGS